MLGNGQIAGGIGVGDGIGLVLTLILRMHGGHTDLAVQFNYSNHQTDILSEIRNAGRVAARLLDDVGVDAHAGICGQGDGDLLLGLFELHTRCGGGAARFALCIGNRSDGGHRHIGCGDSLRRIADRVPFDGKGKLLSRGSGSGIGQGIHFGEGNGAHVLISRRFLLCGQSGNAQRKAKCQHQKECIQFFHVLPLTSCPGR